MKTKLLVLSAALMLVVSGCNTSKKSEFTPDTSASTTETSSSEGTETVSVTGVSLDQHEVNLKVGQSVTLTPTVSPSNATNKNVTWTATGSGVVTVDNGVVTAEKAGESVVTVRTADGGFTDTCTINVSEAVKVDVAYSDGSFDFNGTQQPGKFVYWAGDGGAVSSATYNSSTGKYSLTYTTGWAWYGVQIFYLLPYAEAEDKYDVTWTLNSTAAGNITVNGEVKTLVAGDNVISFTDASLHGNRTLDVQLGVDGGAQFGAGTVSFANPVVYDKNGATYHQTSFINGNQLLKRIQVRNGKYVTAPADPAAPAGKVFAGWYDGTTKFDGTQAVTAAHEYSAKFIDESEATKYTVNVYDGSTLLGSIKVLEGSKVDLSSIIFPFGYEADGYYKNNTLTEVFDPAKEIITGNTDIYAKKRVAVTNSCYNMYEDYITHLADGSLQIKLEGWGANVWDVQLNYVLPTGTHNYTVNYTYSIDKAGADVQIYDGAPKAGPNTLTVGNNLSGQLTYNGALTNSNKLTFELGALPKSQVATFVLHSITLTIA
jgi:hypothetical protein